jgi:hypothetical protein
VGEPRLRLSAGNEELDDPLRLEADYAVEEHFTLSKARPSDIDLDFQRGVQRPAGLASSFPNERLTVGSRREASLVDVKLHVGVAVLLLVLAVCVSSPAGTRTCTVMGTEGPDMLVSGDRNDSICGLGGNDVIHARGGTDHVYGDDGDDTIYGGNRKDFLEGGPGDDLIHGELGDDVLSGGDGSDRLVGSSGFDRLEGEDGADDLAGGDGGDLLYGGSGADELTGGLRGDRLEGGPGRDVLSGGRGYDRFYTCDGARDKVSGGPGIDTAELDGRDVGSSLESQTRAEACAP